MIVKSISKCLAMVLAAACMLAGWDLSAQETQRKITGCVYDEDKTPMVGVGVMVVGTLNGVVTDADGNYSIAASKGQELQFSFLGYKTETLTVGERSVINVTMQSDAQMMESAVVTALGIKRDEKSLGYAAQKVGEEAFSSAANSTNWLSGLTGQVAGLNIAQSNSGPGGTARVTLRGESSADLSNNTALFVVDGVPMFNSATTSDAGGDGSAYAIDYGNGTADINPDDIESITVLKGPAATALYGSSAANGAIIITTKSADKLQSKINVTFSSALTFESVNTSPDLQYVYGQGNTRDYYYYNNGMEGPGYNPETGKSGTHGMESWGPKMDGTMYYQYFNDAKNIGGSYDEMGNFQRVATPFVSYGDWFKDYFETGHAWSNTLTVSGTINRKNSIRISLTDYRNDSTIPNSNSESQRLSMRMRNEFADWFTSEVSLNYRRNFYDNLPVSSGPSPALSSTFAVL